MINQLSFSQSIYPKEVKIGSDTVVCVTFDQLRVINKDLFLVDAYAELIDSLDSVVLDYQKALKTSQNLHLNYQNQIDNLDTQIVAYQQLVTLYEKENVELNKKLKKSKLVNKLIIAAGVISTSVLVFTLLSK